MPRPARRFPIGAEPLADARGTHVRVWAPAHRRVEVACGQPPQRFEPLEPEGDGYFSGAVPGLRAGDRYAFRLDDEPKLLPDPASRFQPDGPHGASEVVSASAFAWAIDS